MLEANAAAEVGEQAAKSKLATYTEYRAHRYFPALDGLRAVAILLVFATHITDQRVLGRLHGGFGVTIFFVLSGFLITTLALREEDRRSRLNIRAFFIRRVFRIAPSYALVLGVYTLALVVGYYKGFKHQILADQLPYFALGFPEHGHFAYDAAALQLPFAQAWSIGIEEKFYLVWPLLAFGLLAAWRWIRPPLAVVLGLFCAVTPLLFHNGVYIEWYAQILAGCFVAFLLHDERAYGYLRRVASSWVFYGVLIAYWAVMLGSSADSIHFRALTNFTAAITAIALVGLVMRTTGIVRGLQTKPMLFMGRISYVFYLIHPLVILAVEKSPFDHFHQRWGVLVIAVVALPISIAASYVIHRLVELPMIHIGRRLGNRDASVMHSV